MTFHRDASVPGPATAAGDTPAPPAGIPSSCLNQCGVSVPQPADFTAYSSNASSKWVQSSVGRKLTIGASTIMTLVGSS